MYGTSVEPGLLPAVWPAPVPAVTLTPVAHTIPGLQYTVVVILVPSSKINSGSVVPTVGSFES